MKKICSLLLFSLFFYLSNAQYCGNSGPAICSPSGSVYQGFFFPADTVLAPLVNGQVSTTVLQMTNFDTLQFNGHTVTVQSLHIDTITGLPQGLCWSTNSSDNTFANQEHGCLKLTGTTCAPPGQYKAHIVVDVNVGFAITTNFDAAGTYIIVRVVNPGEATIPVDTGQTDANPFIPYGPAANCTSVLEITAGTSTTVCSGSNLILNPQVTGGQVPYTYAWSATGNSLSCGSCGNPSATLTQNSVYSVTVTDAANATVTASYTYVVSGSGSIPQLSLGNSNYSCNAYFDTTTLNITGGSAPYAISWGNGITNSTSNNTDYNLYAAGNYVIYVQDANNCLNSVVNSVVFTGVTITAGNTTQPACPNQATGSITLTATGGTAPYSYTWSNGATTSQLSNVPSGSYLVNVTDVNSCHASMPFYLEPASDVNFYVFTQSAPANCSNNGSASAQVYGGTGNVTYAWSNGSTAPQATALGGAVYSVSVTDSLGCVAVGSATVTSSCYTYITGNIFNDINSNCVLDQGEATAHYIYVSLSDGSGNQFYGYTNTNGYYSVAVNIAGTYTINASNSYWGGDAGCTPITSCSGSNTVVVSQLGDTLVRNYTYATNTGFDLTMHPGWTSANPGFQKEYWIMPFSQGTFAYPGQATVVFTYDSNLVYQSSNNPQPVHDAIAHTLTWTVNNVPFPDYDWNNGRFENFFMVPLSLPLSAQLHSSFKITPTANDCDSTNNVLTFTEPVTGSHDPNEKTVFPANRILQDDSVLTYTIHFQNTGTDSTHFIIVTDTLSSLLNPASVRTIASSAPVSKFNITGKGILSWTFNPYRLVDSITDPTGSKGFVTFQVTKKGNAPIGAAISNTAYVYFDYNDAVVTNTVTDTVSLPTYVFAVPATPGVSVRAFPNPFNGYTNIVVDGVTQKFDFEMYDLTGKPCRRITGIQNTQFQVNQENLAQGIYLYRIIVNNNQAAYGKLVIQ